MSEQPSVIEQAEKLKKDLELERAALQKEREALHAERILSGETTVSAQAAPPKEISPKDYAKAADKGIILS